MAQLCHTYQLYNVYEVAQLGVLFWMPFLTTGLFLIKKNKIYWCAGFCVAKLFLLAGGLEGEDGHAKIICS